MFIRILVVDDFARWREQVRSILQTRPELRVVAEAADGLQAVQKAQELKPDLILLDIGLPNLSGIEAAKIIRERCPKSKIVFVTENTDSEIREAAMASGHLVMWSRRILPMTFWMPLPLRYATLRQ